MRNTVKRSLALLLTIVMVMGLVVIPASAARPMGDVAVESAGGDKPTVSSGKSAGTVGVSEAESQAELMDDPDVRTLTFGSTTTTTTYTSDIFTVCFDGSDKIVKDSAVTAAANKWGDSSAYDYYYYANGKTDAKGVNSNSSRRRIDIAIPTGKEGTVTIYWKCGAADAPLGLIKDIGTAFTSNNTVKDVYYTKSQSAKDSYYKSTLSDFYLGTGSSINAADSDQITKLTSGTWSLMFPLNKNFVYAVLVTITDVEMTDEEAVAAVKESITDALKAHSATPDEPALNNLTIDQATFDAASAGTDPAANAKALIESWLPTALLGCTVEVSANVSQAPVAGTSGSAAGTNGAFTYSISVTKGTVTSDASPIEGAGTVAATAYRISADTVTIKKEGEATTAENLVFGGTVTLSAEASEANTTDTITWSTSEATVASVSDSGVVTAKGAGVATITASAMTAGATGDPVTATCTVTVKAADSANNVHTFMPDEVGVFTSGTVVYNSYFTLKSSGKTSIVADKSAMEWEANGEGEGAWNRVTNNDGRRLNVTTTAAATDGLVFTTTAAGATVEVWWMSGGSNRTVKVVAADGGTGADGTTASKNSEKHYDKLTLGAADTYYLGSHATSSATNYIYKVIVTEPAAASVTSQPATGVGVWNFAEKDQIGYELITGTADSQPTKDYGITVAVDDNKATITVDEATALAAWADSTKGARMNSNRMVNTVDGAKYLFVCVFTEIPIEGFSKSSGHKLVIGEGTFADDAIALTGAQGTDIDVVTDGTKWYMGQWFGMLRIDEGNNTLVTLDNKDFEKTYHFYDSTGNLLATRELTVKRVTQEAQSDTHEYALTVGAESATLKLGVAEFEAIDFTATDAVNGGQATAVIPTAVSADENKVGVRVAAADGDSNNKSIVVWAKAATTTPVNVTVTNGDQTKTIAVTVVASDATTGYTLPTTWDLKTAGLLYSVDKYTNGSSYAAAKYKGLIIDGKGSCQFKHDENGLVFHSAGTLSIPVDGASKITVKGSGNATMADSDKTTTTALNSTGVEFNYTGTGPAVLTLAANAKVTDIAVEAVQAPAVEPENATGLGVWSKLAGNIAVSSAYESNSANLEDKTGISFTTNNGVQIKVDETKLRAAYAEPAKAAVINQAGAPMRHGNTLYVAVLSEIPEAVLAVTGWQLVVKVGETRYPTNDSEYATTPSALGIDTATDGAKTYLADWYAVGTCDGSAVGVLAKAAETHETITYEYYGAGATPELLAIRTLALDVDTVLTGAEIPGTVTATDCTDGNNGTIAGLTTDMEVKGPGAEDYTPVAAAGTMSNLAKGTYLVRYAAKAATAEAQAKAAGEPKALTIKGAMTVAVTAPSKVYDGTAIDAVTYTVTDGNANVTTTSVKYAVTANASTQPADNAYVTTVAELDLKAVADTGKEIWVKAEAEGYNAAVGHAAVTITKAAAPTLTIAASSTSVRADETNGATVTLSVTSSVPACVPTVECDKTLTAPSGLTDNHNGTWTAKLPNATETYVFTVKYEATANYNAATSKDVTVKVTKAGEAMASPIDLKVMTQAHYDEDFGTWVGGPNTLSKIHGNDLAVSTSGVVTGSLKFFSGFKGFNASTPAEQQGFYLAVEIPAPDGWASSNTSVNIKTTNPCSAGAPKDATFASNLFAAPGSALTVLFYLDPTVLATAEHAPTITVDWGNGADNDLWLPNSVELDLDGVTFEPTVKQAQILFVDDAASYQAAFGTTMPTDHNLQLPWIVVKYNRTVAGEVAVEIKKGGNAVALVGATTAPGAADNANAYFSYHMVSQADTDHSGQDYINQAVAAGEYTATVTQHGTTATAVAATYNKYPVTVADVEGATVALSATAPANQNLLVAKDTEVTVTVTVTDNTKEVDTVKVNNGSAITAETNGTYKFTMPEAAANVVVTLKEKVVAPTNHNLTVTLAQATATVKVGEGEAETLTSAEAKAIAEDSVITVVVTPADGYELPETLTVDSLTATDDYTWTIAADGKGTLVILANKFKADLAVTITATEKVAETKIDLSTAATVAITGTAKVGEELAAEVTFASLVGTDITGHVDYKWTVGGTDVEGNNAATYTVVAADLGKTITVTVSAKANDEVYTGSKTSAATAAVVAKDEEQPVEVDKTALTDAIAAATTLKDGTTYTTQADNLPGVKYWDTALKTAYETAIAEAQTVADNAEATADDVAAAVTALATATDTFKAGKTDGNKTIDDDKLDEALTEAIEAAEAAKKGVVANDATDPKKVKKGTKYVPTAVMTALESAIADAQELLDALTDEDDTNDPTKAAVTAAVAALQNATIDFKPETGTQSTGGGGGAGGSVSNTNTTKTETLADGTKRTTETAKDGTVTVTDVKPDGTKVVSTTTPDGETTVKVTVPANVDTAKVKVPVADNADTGMVAVVVKPDGTEEVIRDSIVVDGEMVFDLDDSAEVKLVNRAKSFVDVPGHWAENEVNFVTARDLFNGVDATHFAPDTAMTRGMMATVLFRLDGELKGDKNANFADVKEGEWYTEAVDWASDAAVITGYTDGTFAPNKAITRQELVLMVYRYAGAPAVNGKANVAKFNDADKVADWAADAMEWAIANGIINGKGNGIIDPAANATRAEVSAVLERFVKNAAQ